jgi:DNA polymerase III delta subunit
MKLPLAQVVPSLGEKSIRSYVLYGSNAVLMQGIVQEINELFDYTSIPADQLLAYRDDLETPMLFGKKPYVVHVEGSINWSVLGPILRTWPKNYAVVAQMSTCPLPWSKYPDIAAVACYDCTLSESKAVLRRYLNREKITMEPEAFEWCAVLTQSGQWQNVMRVVSLMGGDARKSFVLDDLRGIFPEPWHETSLAILQGGANSLSDDDMDDPIKIIRSWQRLMMQVWQLKQLLQTHSAETAMESVRPAVFFKHKAVVLKSAEKWSTMRVIRCLGQLIQAEVQIKKDPLMAKSLLLRLLHQV